MRREVVKKEVLEKKVGEKGSCKERGVRGEGR